MSLPLDIGEQLIDRGKSSLYLYYVARATHRVMEREISRKKVEIALKQLKKLSTKDLHKHLEALEAHIKEAIHREKQIQGSQKGEDLVHGELKHKITKLESRLGRYLETQEARKERMQELEDKIKTKFSSKKERISELKSDYKRLMKLYQQAKKSKASKSKLLRIAKRMEQLKARISTLK